MLHESSHVRVSTDDGIGTLWLSPPGGRIGAGVLRELLPALDAVAHTPGVEILVLRSGTPVGFGRGLDPDSLHEGLVSLGQRVTGALAELPIPTVAFLEGPCLGPGLELALACDYRLAVAGPDSWVSFDTPFLGWGGQTRLRQLVGQVYLERPTAREAVREGIFDLAFCERRAKIELRTWLDRLQFKPHKRAAGWRRWFMNSEAGFVAERKTYRASLQFDHHFRTRPIFAHRLQQPLRSVGMIGTGVSMEDLAAELTIRGIGVVWVDAPKLSRIYNGAVFDDGRITPLEAEQAAKRIRFVTDADALTACDWVFLSDPHTDLAGMLERDLPPRAILSVPPVHLERVALLASRPPRVVGLQLFGASYGELATLTDADPDATATVAGWLGMIGVTTTTTAMVPVPAYA
jgi:enoyl-CoA hydratase